MTCPFSNVFKMVSGLCSSNFGGSRQTLLTGKADMMHEHVTSCGNVISMERDTPGWCCFLCFLARFS